MQYCSRCKRLYPKEMQFCPVHGEHLERQAELAPGTVLREKYEILEEIGSGGMGRVFRVRDLDFAYGRNQSAMKIPSEQIATDPDYVRRFRDEAAKARVLNHPNIVRIEHIDRTEAGIPFLVMELVEGRSLRVWMDYVVRAGWRDAAAIAREIAIALDAAHSTGLVHCDIKPENVLSVSQTAPLPLKVTDFGLAKTTDALRERMTRMRTETTWGAGIVVGTPDYMSPEQARGRENVGPPSDIYSLGVVMIEMLTGELPFGKLDSAEEARQVHQQLQPALLSARGDLPPALVSLARQMLDRTAESRPTASATAAALERLLHGTVVEPRKVEPTVVEAIPAHQAAPAGPTSPRQDVKPDVVSKSATQKRPLRRVLWAIGGLLACVVGVVVWHPWPYSPLVPVYTPATSPSSEPSASTQASTSASIPAPADQPQPAPVATDSGAPSGNGGNGPGQAAEDDLLPWLKRSLVASEGPDVENLRAYYAESVTPYYTIPNATWADIEQDKQAYFKHFPQIQYDLASWTHTPQADGSEDLDFEVQYSATRKDGTVASGVSHQWANVRFEDGAWRITGIRNLKP